MRDYEVVIPTLGKNLVGVLAGLVQHVPPALRLITARVPTDTATLYLLETLRRLGCRVTVELETQAGIGEARYQGAMHATAPVLVYLDDDVVLVGDDPLGKLALAALYTGFAVPVMRYPQNFITPTIEGLREVWEVTSPDDARVAPVLAGMGQEWARIYDFGEDQRTGFLNGSCFAVERGNMVAHGDVGGLGGVGGEDTILGHKLGEGVVVSGVYGYHFGHFTLHEWHYEQVGLRLLLQDPDRFYQLAKKTTGN